MIFHYSTKKHLEEIKYGLQKNQFGASMLFSLADFKTDKVRNKSAFDKNYLEGKYGAIPYFDMDEKLNDLLYGRKKEAEQV
jgi:hypothetical protein